MLTLNTFCENLKIKFFKNSDCKMYLWGFLSNKEFRQNYSASHSWVAPENIGFKKEQKYNTFACHTCNEVRLCVLWIKKEVGNTKR
jgi:hypothetical protein